MRDQAQDSIFVAPTDHCAEGRVEVEMGYCCWPGQHATEDGRCLGPPTCPGRLVATGADCTAPVAAATTTPPRATPADDGSFRTSPTPRAGNEIDGPLLGGGITLILVGWLGAGITDTLGGGQVVYTYGGSFGSTYRPALPLWPFGWLPVLHPLAAINSNGTWGGVAGVVGSISAAMEIAGLVMAIVGTIGHARAETPSWSLRAAPPGSDVGTTLAIEL